MALRIPLKQVSSQSLSVLLGAQECVIKLYHRGSLYADLYVSGINIFRGVPCRNRIGLKLYDYLNFNGNLVFIDLDGEEDPDFKGLDERFILLYLDENEALIWGKEDV